MRTAITTALLLSAAICPTWASAQTGLLGRLVGALSRPAQAGRPDAVSGGVTSPGMTVQPTAQQVDTLRRALLARQADPRVARDVADASPLIQRLALTGACAVDTSAWNAFARESVEPRNWLDGLYMHLPRDGDRYHDRRSCLDVLRVADYEKPAANALRFRSFYISPQSGRPRSQTFTIVRSAEGTWLVDEIGQVR